MANESEEGTVLEPERKPSPASFVRLHLLWGFGGLFLYSLLGIALESLLAYKAPFLIDVQHTERRLLFRLAHAHGTLLSLFEIAFAFVLTRLPPRAPLGRRLRLASGSLSAATLLIPSGFFLGGLGAESGDPGLLVALVPTGAFVLLVGLALTFWEVFAHFGGKPR